MARQTITFVLDTERDRDVVHWLEGRPTRVQRSGRRSGQPRPRWRHPGPYIRGYSGIEALRVR